MGPLLEHLAPFFFVAARLAGLFLFAPVLASPMIPWSAKPLLLLGLAAAAYPAASGALLVPAEADVFTLALLVVSESLIGAAMGLAAIIPLAALELAGFLAGHQIGFGLARVYNPDSDVETDVLGQLLFFLALAAFLGMGGLESLFLGVIATFERVPVGGFSVDGATLDMLAGILASGFELSLRVAAPVLALIFLELLAMGILMKTMPQLNVLTYGFAVKIVTAIAVLALAVGVIHQVGSEAIADSLRQALAWIDGVNGGAGGQGTP